MDAIIATLIATSGDIMLTIEYYRNYFAFRKAAK